MSDEDWKPETKEGLKRAGGARCLDVNASLFYRTLQTVNIFRGDGSDTKEEMRIAAVTTGHLMASFKPADEVEGMFAAQAVMLHNLSMEAGRRAMIPEQPSEIASKLRKDAANSARAFGDMVDALARYRGKGPQVVRVERVVVNEGGQAIVGPVTAGTSSLTSGVPQPVIANGVTPSATGDDGEGVAGDVRGEGE